MEAALIKIEAVLAADPRLADGHYPRWLATKLLEMDPDAIHRLEQSPQKGPVMAQVDEAGANWKRPGGRTPRCWWPSGGMAS